MNPRVIVNFVRSPLGLLLLFFLLVFIVLFFLRNSGVTTRRDQEQPFDAKRPDASRGPTTFETGNTPPRFPREAAPTPAPRIEQRAEPSPPPPPPLTLYASRSISSTPAQLLQSFAPYGRLVKCQLVNTVDSARVQTPIIGLVTEDVNQAGRRVIPAGTEVHGTAQLARSRDRISSGNAWVFVFREEGPGFHNGEELELRGVALDRDEIVPNQQWEITDGSAGLRGQVLKSDNLAEVKLFAATALSGLAAGFQDTQSNAFGGTTTKPTARTAVLQAASAVGERYAQIILDAIERDGLYVRVPAGKQFYVYLTQTVDKGEAKVGTYLSRNLDGRPAGRAPAGALGTPGSVEFPRGTGGTVNATTTTTTTATGTGAALPDAAANALPSYSGSAQPTTETSVPILNPR